MARGVESKVSVTDLPFSLLLLLGKWLCLVKDNIVVLLTVEDIPCRDMAVLVSCGALTS